MCWTVVVKVLIGQFTRLRFLQTGWNIRDLLRSLTTFLITLADEIATTFERGRVKNDP